MTAVVPAGRRLAGVAEPDEALLDRLLDTLDLPARIRLVSGATMWTTHAESVVGLRAMVTSDGPVGVRGQSWDERDTALVTPSPTALAATWDPELVREVGVLLAAECRRKGVDVLLAPTLNLHRSPLGGRHFECYSEDPHLVGEIGVAMVSGLQSAGVAASPKHYVANDSETERFTLDARVDERTLRELYLAPFERVVTDGGAWLVMSAYNGVNGTTMSASPLLHDPLKREWGFDGVVVSDWTAVRTTEASGRAAQDLAMPGPEGAWGAALLAAVEAGLVPPAAVADKVRRLLRLAWRVGALADGPAAQVPAAVPEHEARALLRRVAAAGTVLLRNVGGLLPLAESVSSVAVLGPNAAVPREQGGGSAEVFAARVVTPLEGLVAALGSATVRHVGAAPGRRTPEPVRRGDVTDPVTGEAGLRSRYLDDSGVELGSDRRLTGRLVWTREELPPATAVVEVVARLQVDVTGRWWIGLGGTGWHSLLVDGRAAFEGDITPDSDDIATVNLAPPTVGIDVDLVAGRAVEVVTRHRVGTAMFGVSTSLVVARPRRDAGAELADAVAAARAADVAVVVVGTTPQDESEGFDRASLRLPEGQDDLVRAVLAANPRTVVVVNSGGPVELPWLAEAPAVLLTWFAGQEGGGALADVLTGVCEPGGRMPTTWAIRQADAPVLDVRPVDGVLDYAEGLHVGYRAWLRSGVAPAAWFGHGLGYTDWEYVRAEAPDAVRPGEPVTLRVGVRNTGRRTGADVVQVYVSRPDSAHERPQRWLGGFARVEAAPGEQVEVTVTVPARAMQHWDEGWRTEVGAFGFHVGRSVVDLRAHCRVVVA